MDVDQEQADADAAPLAAAEATATAVAAAAADADGEGDGEGDGDDPADPKRKSPLTREEGIKKVKRTIGWYNKHGGLQSQIHYRTISQYIEALNPREALKILNQLEEKGPTIQNPTAWVKKAAENLGPELDKKVRKTIAWYNRNGELQEPIKYDEVRELLAYVSPAEACKLLSSLDGKGSQIQKPTAYLCKAARNKLERDGPSPQLGAAWGLQAFGGGGRGIGKGPGVAALFGLKGGWGRGRGAPGIPVALAQASIMAAALGPKGLGIAQAGMAAVLDPKVKKTIGWYNKNGNLQGEIHFDEVAPLLALVGTSEALKILDGLDPEKGRNTQIKNPTAWIKKAAQNLLN